MIPQLVKDLSHKHEDLSSCEKLSVIAYTCNPSTGGRMTGSSQELTGQLP